MSSFIRRWKTFVAERFEPVSHALMIVTFVGANAYFVHALSGKAFSPVDVVLTLVICGLVFFHLRLFDEWKDFEVDCQVNPDRPLPRGLIEKKEYQLVTAAVIGLESLLAAFVGVYALIALLMAVGYSLLMLKEFFVGSWLSPKLELYALSHTLIAAWIALFIYAALAGVSVLEIPPAFGAVMVVAWMLFNIFEFARKTFAKEEERKEVESYSKRLRPLGAVALVWICMALALGALYLLMAWGYLSVVPVGIVAGVSVVAGFSSITYLAKDGARPGKIYRGVHSLYLVVFNAVFCVYGALMFIG